MAFVRPSCAALRPTTSSIVNRWNLIPRSFSRQICVQRTPTSPCSRPSILSSLKFEGPSQSCRSISSSLRCSAKVNSNETPLTSKPTAPKTRAIRIGPLPGGNADRRRITAIFGPNISVEEGNHVLRIIHHRRTSGSLADYGVDNLGRRYDSVTHSMAVKALAWLRKQYPIDEARAAEEWAEKEANRISYEMWLADPENADSKYNDPARIWRDQQRQLEEQHDQAEKRMGILRVGPSEFERNVKRKREERLEAMAKKAEEQDQKEAEEEKMLATGEWVRTPRGTALMKPGQSTYVDVFGREQVSRRKEMAEYYQKKAETPFKSVEDMLSKTTLLQRLAPMTAFVFALCVLSYGFAHYYDPPAAEYRLIPEVSLTTATIVGLIATNVFVCAMWRINPLWPFMTRYFMHVPGYPRAAQAILNVFSHVQYEHLLANMMFLGLVGFACHDLVDRGIFMGTYLSAGAVGTLASLYWANLGRGNITAHSVGASAAIWGISALYCLLTDQEKIKIPYTSNAEVSFWPKTLFAAFVAMELYNAMKKGGTTMDHASHFGGMLVGATVAGYLNATGFHERKSMVTPAWKDDKTVDVAAIVTGEAKDPQEDDSKKS
ncbi:hypothetical protein BU24DRAFT_340954 [Aaosphaeria arxii CBS 175.79]|uniref:Peptidase S54 rhomboid domain-containing protein n=1 Tax=Aaosphaeria arxii CBS 175.79 TaxID=1450172 RepID=A0A6A5Y1M3_9PLEO|nr:uncharacterized protein BU24DRAFT_340954 [Aaosphaeria arxii CBS 175.79]KAF2018957.1 hypothetical protein BU24DRAFT_340954 [Aaosphaeria arxii CBS 175.79]